MDTRHPSLSEQKVEERVVSQAFKTTSASFQGLELIPQKKKPPFGSHQRRSMILAFLSNEHLCQCFAVFLTGESYVI